MKTRLLLAQNLICRIALAANIKPKQSNLNALFEQFKHELFPFIWLKKKWYSGANFACMKDLKYIVI